MAPTARETALIGKLKGAALLESVRGAPPAERCPGRLIAALSRSAAAYADAIADIGLNPLIFHPQTHGLTIVEALIVKRQAANS